MAATPPLIDRPGLLLAHRGAGGRRSGAADVLPTHAGETQRAAAGPTHHLDLESINALNIALQRYDGTVLLVTHDHNMIDEVASRIWSFADGAIEDFKGPYEEFRAAREKVA